MHGPGVSAATIGMVGLRMATGFFFFHVGFSLKTSGAPAWLIGGVAAAVAVGGFAGTFVAPRLHGRLHEQEIITASLFLLAAFAGLAALRFHGSTAVALGLALGVALSVGRRAFDSVIQTEAPHARRGRAYAGLETRLEVGWVIGAFIAVIARSPDWLGLLVMAVAVGALSVDRIASHYSTGRVAAETGAATLPIRLLETAEAVAARGDRQQAVLVALAAADAASMVGSVPAESLAVLQRRGREAATDRDPSLGGRGLAAGPPAGDRIGRLSRPSNPGGSGVSTSRCGTAFGWSEFVGGEVGTRGRAVHRPKQQVDTDRQRQHERQNGDRQLRRPDPTGLDAGADGHEKEGDGTGLPGRVKAGVGRSEPKETDAGDEGERTAGEDEDGGDRAHGWGPSCSMNRLAATVAVKPTMAMTTRMSR